MRLGSLVRPTLVLFNCVFASADIPAHCLLSDVLGSWSYQLSPPVGNPLEVQASCDQLDVLPYALDITLTAPNRAVDANGNVGNWTMVYDQGFEVTLPDSQDTSTLRTFFHFMKYTQSGQNVTTDCGASLRGYGWVHDVSSPAGAAPQRWQCYVATRQGDARIRHHMVAAHGPGRLLGVPRSEQWMADAPRAVPYQSFKHISHGMTVQSLRSTRG